MNLERGKLYRITHKDSTYYSQGVAQTFIFSYFISENGKISGPFNDVYFIFEKVSQ